MKYYSLTNPDLTASFGEALLSSLAPDGGLYMPQSLPKFTPQQLADLGAMSFAQCAAKLARHFVDDHFSETDLDALCEDAYDFDMPMRAKSGYVLDPALNEDEDEFFLELFHGPTLAFKDFAARFMGRAASHMLTRSGEQRTILVATSGDTGGAIGYAFLNQPGIKVYILYPEGGVSKVQEQQLTTMGADSNIKAIKVNGSFDDAQALVKHAFADKALSQKHNLMSANSINVGRVIPQSFYYFWTSLQAKAAYPARPLVYSIPSGNLGNLTGGLIAKRMGAPIDRFVVGHNANDPLIDYLSTGKYAPRPSVPTLSNAMDIGRPNNFPRILSLYKNSHSAIAKDVWGASYDDDVTARHLRRVYNEHGYLMCPHTTVGHLAMTEFNSDVTTPFTKITVATAHPGKFQAHVDRITREDIPVPKALSDLFTLKPSVHLMSPQLSELADYLDATA